LARTWNLADGLAADVYFSDPLSKKFRWPPKSIPLVQEFDTWFRDELQKLGSIPDIDLQMLCLLVNLPVSHSIRELTRAQRQHLKSGFLNLIQGHIGEFLHALETGTGKDRRYVVPYPLSKRYQRRDPIPITDEEFEIMRRQSRFLFNQWQNILRGQPSDGFGVASMLLDFNFMRDARGNMLQVYFADDMRTVFMLAVCDRMHALRYHGFSNCPNCRRVFVGPKGKLYCTRACLDASKARRHKQNPDRNEDQALLMWRKAWRRSHGGNDPTEKRKRDWLTHYRAKRVQHNKPASSRPVADVLRPR
jgi:hypothetical protein